MEYLSEFKPLLLHVDVFFPRYEVNLSTQGLDPIIRLEVELWHPIIVHHVVNFAATRRSDSSCVTLEEFPLPLCLGALGHGCHGWPPRDGTTIVVGHACPQHLAD